jgi:hypothetical protein
LPDNTTIREPECAFQSKSSRTPICLTKRGIMDTPQNPNEPGKSNTPGQQGGQQQDRARQERAGREREKQGGQQGGGQQGGGQQGGR